jgi:hypothetical protein
MNTDFLIAFITPDIAHTSTTNSNVFTTTLIISSVSGSILFFIIGIICGQITWLIKKIKSKPLKSGRNSPVYEVVQPIPSSEKNQQTPKEVNVQLNEAYGPL